MQKIFNEYLYTPELQRYLDKLAQDNISYKSRIIFITPDKFFNLTTPNTKALLLQLQRDEKDQACIQAITKKISTGEPLPITVISVLDNKFFDGWHRMYALKIKYPYYRFPVLFIYNDMATLYNFYGGKNE